MQPDAAINTRPEPAPTGKSPGPDKPRPSGRFARALGALLRSRLYFALAVGSTVVVLSTLGLAIWLRAGNDDEARLETAILEALDRNDLPLVHQLADTAVQGEVSPEAYRAAVFALLVAYAQEADKQVGPERNRLLTLAAAYGSQAHQVGFPAGREGEGTFLLSRTLHSLCRFAESRVYLREALKLAPHYRAEINWLLAESHLLDPRGRKEEALKFNQAFLLTPNLPPSSRSAGLIQRVRIALAQRDFAQAENVLAELGPAGSNSVEVLFLRNWIELEKARQSAEQDPAVSQEKVQKMLRAALSGLTDVTKKATMDESLRAQAVYLSGVCQTLLGELDSARAAWERCVVEFPDYPEALACKLALVRQHLQIGQLKEAADELATFLAQIAEPATFANRWFTWDDVQTVVKELVELLTQNHQYSVVLKLADAMQPVFSPANVHELRAVTYSAWAEFLVADGQKRSPEEGEAIQAEAKKCFRLAGDAFTRLARVRMGTRYYTEDLWQAGECYFRGQCYSRATRILREYLRNEPRRRNPLALLRLGECLLAMGHVDDALLVLNECIEFHKRDAASYQARLLAADAYLEKDEVTKAEELLLANLGGELAPTSLEWRDSLFALGTLYYHRGRDAEAIPKLEEAIRRYPQDPRAVKATYMLAEIYARMAEPDSLSTPGGDAPAQRAVQVRELLTRSLDYYQLVQSELDARWGQVELSPEERGILRNTLFGIAEVAYRLGRFGDAMVACSAIINRFQGQPEVLEAYVHIARCRRAMGQENEARIAIEQARIVLARLPSDLALDTTTPFNSQEWSERLTALARKPSLP